MFVRPSIRPAFHPSTHLHLPSTPPCPFLPRALHLSFPCNHPFARPSSPSIRPPTLPIPSARPSLLSIPTKSTPPLPTPVHLSVRPSIHPPKPPSPPLSSPPRSICPSVRPSVRPSIHQKHRQAIRLSRYFSVRFCLYLFVSVCICLYLFVSVLTGRPYRFSSTGG